MVVVTNREWPIEVITLSSDHSRDSDDSNTNLLYNTYHRPQLFTGIYPHLSKYLHWLYLLLRFTIIYMYPYFPLLSMIYRDLPLFTGIYHLTYTDKFHLTKFTLIFPDLPSFYMDLLGFPLI